MQKQTNKKTKKKFNPFSIKVVFYYIKYYKVSIICQFLLAILSSSLAIGVNIGLQYALAASSIDFQYISMVCGTLIGLFCANWFIQYLQYYLSVNMGQKISKRIRDDVFRKLNNLSISYYDKNKSGDIISKFSNDITNLSTLLSNNLADIISASLWIFGLIIGMMLVSPVLSVITIVLSTLVAISIFLCFRKSHPYFSKTQKSLSKVTEFLDEAINSQAIIDIFNQKELMFNKFDELNKTLTNNVFKAQSYSSSSFPITNFATNFVSVIVTLIGMAFIWANNDAFIGIHINLAYPSPLGTNFITLTVFLLLSRNFLSPFSQMSSILPIILSAKAGVDRLANILESTDEFNSLEKLIVNIAFSNEKKHSTNKDVLNLKPRVEFEDVSFSYIENKPVLKNVSFNIEPGQFIGLVGPTGSGKTTIINLITKFYEINSGDIKIDGVSIKDISRKSLRENIAMVVQDTYIFNISVKENIKIAKPSATDEEVINAAKLAMCHDLIMSLKDGYDTVLENNADVLSKGEKQLISIARAILSDAEFIILDEATSSIDTKTEKIIQHAFENIMKNKTCILIAHRLSTVRNADKIIVLKDGEILEQGNHEELLEYGGFYSKLINSQFSNILD